MDINDEQREEWQALADAATDGPWEIDLDGDIQGRRKGCSPDPEMDPMVGTLDRYEDTAFIAAARTAVPALLAALRETEAERDALARRAGAVRTIHRRFEIYESEDACPDTSDEHREEHHHEDSDGHMEYFCDQMYIYTACDHCRYEDGERVEWPCETIQALDGKN